MQNSEERACHPVHTQNGPFIKSPISKSFDQGIDTPQKLPAAPHPSPINMDTESCNPKSKEMFRAELLKACLLKIPEAVSNESVFNDNLLTRSSLTCEDQIPDLADGPQGLHKNPKSESDWVAKDEIPTSTNVKDSLVNFNPRHCSKLFENVNLKYSPYEYASANVTDFSGNSEYFRNVNSFHFGNNGSIVDSVNGEEGAGQLHNDTISRVAFYDHITDHQEISRLFNVNSEKKEHSDSMFGGRSPCSDNMSTVAVCASDASDISDEDLSTRSMDLSDLERPVNRPSNPRKKKSRSAVRRFLNWRRTLKFRKRAGSLDECRFPFLANRFESYKTEFELSV